MLKRGLGFCAAIAITSVAYGGAVIEVLPRDAGPWDPGATVTMDVFLTQEPGGFYRGIRGIQFDFDNSDPDLGLAEEFTFDYSSVTLGDALYAEFNELPRPSTVFFLANYPNENPFDPFEAPPWSQSMLVLPVDGQFHIGSIDVTLPLVQGEFTLDLLNAPGAVDDPPPPGDVGAWLRYGFGLDPGDPLIMWVPTDPDDIAGGTFTFGGRGGFGYTSQSGGIVPEPASMVLLAIGVLVGMGRRRGA